MVSCMPVMNTYNKWLLNSHGLIKAWAGRTHRRLREGWLQMEKTKD